MTPQMDHPARGPGTTTVEEMPAPRKTESLKGAGGEKETCLGPLHQIGGPTTGRTPKREEENAEARPTNLGAAGGGLRSTHQATCK